MSDSAIRWGGLIKNIAAGAAIVAGIALVAPSLIPDLIHGIGSLGSGTAGTAAPLLSEGLLKGMGEVVRYALGAGLAITGLTYLFSDHNDNGERHAEAFTEARESFQIREDIRKMQAVMKIRMQAAGHEPAMAIAAPAQR